MGPADVKECAMNIMISATSSDNVTKFEKGANIVSDLNNYLHSIKEENKGKEYEPKKFQPSIVFNKSDGNKMYIIHHILRNSAVNILKFVIDNMRDWSVVHFNSSLYLSSYSWLHLSAFTMNYHLTEPQENEESKEAESRPKAFE